MADIVKPVLEHYERQCRETEDPVYVWLAIKHLKGLNYPYPKWVSEYLSHVSEEILSLDSTGKDFPNRLVKALGVKSGAISKAIKFSRDIDIYLDVEKLKEEGHTLTVATEKLVAKYFLSESAIRDIHSKIRKSS